MGSFFERTRMMEVYDAETEKKNLNVVNVYGDSVNITGEIVRGMTISQVFVATSEHLRYVAVNLATYMRKNRGSMRLAVAKLDGTVLKSVADSVSLMKDNAFHKFRIEVDLQKGVTYQIILKADSSYGSAVTARYGRKQHEENLPFSISGRQLLHHELSCYFEYSKKNTRFDRFRWEEKEKTSRKNIIVVYTANIGGYDKLANPGFLNMDFDYVCFSDRKDFRSDVYKPIHLPVMNNDPHRTSRHPKILPHKYFPQYEYSVYVDANIMVVGNVAELIARHLADKDIMMVRHKERRCVYDEHQACLKLLKDNPKVMSRQMEKYQKEGFPRRNGLCQCGVMIRRHNKPHVAQAMETWWKELQQGSRRDQLSFPYMAWKEKLEYNIMEQDEFRRYFVIMGAHLK